MALRGEALRQHILHSAKTVFLELGFERTSMDEVAARAGTSKRTLYTYFASKDNLFLAVIPLVRELYLGNLRTPDRYADDPREAVARYCGRFLHLMLWQPALRTCRMAIAEAERLPEASAQFYDAIAATVQDRLAAYLVAEGLGAEDRSREIAAAVIGQTVFPRLFAALLGAEPPLLTPPDDGEIDARVDLAPIRRLIAQLVG